MAEKWTDEQERAISTTDRGVIVPAAAGSGKTTVLIERTVRLLEDKLAEVPAERLMAVTFSRDAAEQIRSKLRTALTKRIVGETDSDRREWLARQQEMLPLAKISTINAFCLGIVKENLASFDYRSGLRICDDTQAASIIADAWRDVCEKFCTEQRERFDLLMDAFTDGSEEQLCEQVVKLYDFRRSLAFPKEWNADAIKKLQSKSCADEMLNGVIKLFMRHIDRAVGYTHLLEKPLERMPEATDTLKSIPASDRAQLENLRAILGKGDYAMIYKAFGELTFDRMTLPKEAKIPAEKLAEYNYCKKEAKRIRDNKMKKRIEKIKDVLAALGSDPYEYMRVSALIFEALSDMTDLLEKEVGERKTDSGLAQFGDIERMAMELLVKLENGTPVRTELARTIREQHTYAVMLIDEFQDVNNLEETIFRAISDTDDISVLGKNVFVVGDVKQSIYRFRQANPLLFRKAIENARENKDGGLCEIRLTKNFRSRKNILDFVNQMFSRLMSPELGEIEYTDGERLNCGASYEGADPPVMLMFTEVTSGGASGNAGDDDGDPLKYVIFGEEELNIARRIKQMLDEGALVTNGKSGKRRCIPSDFCVLSRNNSGCQRIAAALSYVGLRADSEQTEGYMGSREIVIMLNLLRVIDNPMNDNAMASVMLSPIMGFTADELGRLRLYCFDEAGEEKKHLAQIITAVSKTDDSREREAERIDTGDEVLAAKCRAVQSFLDRLGFLAISMTLEELISCIYEETDIFAAASASENSVQRRANLRLLTQRAAEYERDMTGGISGFLRFLDGISAAKMDFKQAVTVTAGKDAVSVKTFHRSKGLEYPFVFLSALGKKFNDSDKSEPLLLNAEGGVGIRFKRHDKLMTVRTLSHTALSDVTLREQLSEELRLLYVAMTRAKEQLFIPITLKRKSDGKGDDITALSETVENIVSGGGLSPALLSECNCNRDWLCCALLTTNMRGALLEKAGRQIDEARLAELSPEDESPADAVWELYSGTAAEEKKPFVKAPEPDMRTVRELTEKYAFAFSDDETRAPAKRTVTELVKEMRTRAEGDEKTDKLFFPRLGTLGEEAERLSAAQKGTYTHLFMQLADYGSAEKDVKEELERLKAAGRFTEREAKGVYIDRVKAFFASDLYARMKRSDKIERELKFMVRARDAGLGERYAGLISPDGMLQGVCDCVFREEDGFVLVDYKTDNFTDASELDKYAVQLELYKAALDLILPMPVKACCIYSFKLGVSKEIAV